MSDQMLETTQVFAPKVELPQLLEKMGEIKAVATKPAKVSRDIASDSNIFSADLPIVGGDIYTTKATEILARIVTGNGGGIKDGVSSLSFKTGSSGRADYLLPMIFKVRNGKDVVMSAIMTKGSGSLRALEDTGSPFAKRGGGAEIEGAATINDIRLDAKNSRILHHSGVRTRVALGIYSLDEIEYEGEIYSPQELLDKKIVQTEEDLPGIGVFASRSALRMEDVESIIKRNQTPEINALIGYLIRTTEFDDALEFRDFYQKHKEVIGELGNLSFDQREKIIADYALSLSAVLGRQAAKFEKLKTIKIVKDSFGMDIDHETSNNVTCLGESVDNSQLITEAGEGRIAEFQKSLLDLALSIPSFMKMDPTESMALRCVSETKFIDAYLDEMVPEWRKSTTIPENFLATEAEKLEVDQDGVRRAYWITRLKHEGITKEKVEDEIKNSDLGNLVYDLLSHTLHDDHMYTKSGKFLAEYLRNFKT